MSGLLTSINVSEYINGKFGCIVLGGYRQGVLSERVDCTKDSLGCHTAASAYARQNSGRIDTESSGT